MQGVYVEKRINSVNTLELIIGGLSYSTLLTG